MKNVKNQDTTKKWKGQSNIFWKVSDGVIIERYCKNGLEVKNYFGSSISKNGHVVNKNSSEVGNLTKTKCAEEKAICFDIQRLKTESNCTNDNNFGWNGDDTPPCILMYFEKVCWCALTFFQKRIVLFYFT